MLDSHDGPCHKRQRMCAPESDIPNVWQQVEVRRAGICTDQRHRRALLRNLEPKLLKSMHPTEFSASRYDKAFACAWVRRDMVAIGTKSNNLLVLHTSTGRLVDIALPPPPSRPRPFLHPNAGIHCIATNPSHTMLATGGAIPSDCVLFDIPSMEPLATIQGHQDWLFGSAWVTDRHVVTASRDSTIKLWCVDDADTNSHAGIDEDPTHNITDTHAVRQVPTITTPRAASDHHQARVRDIKYCSNTARVASVSTNGKLVLWDSNLVPQQTATLKNVCEIVCLSIQGNTIVTGSRPQVSVLDTRQSQPILAVTSPEPYQGVRCVQLDGDRLMFGTGSGRLYFYDVRAQRYFNHLDCGVDTTPDTTSSRDDYYTRGSGLPFHIKTGQGWLDHNSTYRDYFNGVQVNHACYTAAWDPSHTRLFVGGGPLACGLRGCYLGMWM